MGDLERPIKIYQQKKREDKQKKKKKKNNLQTSEP